MNVEYYHALEKMYIACIKYFSDPINSKYDIDIHDNVIHYLICRNNIHI